MSYILHDNPTERWMCVFKETLTGRIKHTAQAHSWAAHLAIAGESGVVEEKVGTKEEDDGVEHTQACPIHEDRPAEEGVLCYVPGVSRRENTSVE